MAGEALRVARPRPSGQEVITRKGRVGSSDLLAGWPLEPTTYRRPIRRVLRGKAGLEVTLLPRDDDKPHESRGHCEGPGNPKTVEPERDSQLEDQARKVDGVAAKAVGPAANDLGGRLMAGVRDFRGTCGAVVVFSHA